MNAHRETLGRDLSEAADLLHKYGHHGQAVVLDDIVTTLETAEPDYERLASLDMWGGSGAVWEVWLAPSSRSDEDIADQKSFRGAIVRIAAAMEQLKIGTKRSRFIAETLQGWLNKGL